MTTEYKTRKGVLHEDLTDKILRIYYLVYNELGHGFLESVYEAAMRIALESAGLKVATQLPVPVWFRGHKTGDFKADMLVNELVLIELKAARAIESSHEAQLLNYLRATSVEVGQILNFGPKPQFRRLAFANDRKAPQLQKASTAVSR